MDTCDALVPTQDMRYTVIAGIARTVGSSIPYGAQLVLQWICIIILRRPTSTSMRARNLLLGATLLMTISSSVWVAFSVARSILALLDAPSNDFVHLWTGAGMDATFFLNAWIGDVVMFWRVWVLWKHKRIAVYIPGILFICTSMLTLGFLLHMITSASSGRQKNDELHLVLAYITYSFWFVTNLAMNLSIGYYTWLHWKAVRGFLENGSQQARHEKVLMLFVESGVAYTIILLFGGIINSVSIALESLTWTFVHNILIGLGMGMVSIYPSLLIVVVFLRKSTWDSDGNVLHTRP